MVVFFTTSQAVTPKYMQDFLDTDYVPIPERTNLGTSYLTYDGLLADPGLKVHEDGGAAGCGGKLWPAGELLSRYMIRTKLGPNVKKIIELGSGTGLVGLAIAYDLESREDSSPSKDLSIYITDIEKLVPLMQNNADLNNLSHIVKPAVLNWGEDLPEYAQKPDLILAADCVYLESAFPLLEKTLLDLTLDNPVPILMAYKKRRKADARFFKAIKKHFTVTEIKDHADYDLFFRQSVYLFEMHRRK